MPALSNYANVDREAVALIVRKGYQLWRDDKAKLVYAEKDGWDFAADDAVALLGIIVIFESKNPDAYREYWWRDASNTMQLTDLPTFPQRSYESVVNLRKAK